MSKFKDEVESLNENPDFQDFMSEEEDKEMMQNTIMNKRIEEGRNEGIRETKLETAKKMLKDKLSIDMISKYTGLSEKEIRSL